MDVLDGIVADPSLFLDGTGTGRSPHVRDARHLAKARGCLGVVQEILSQKRFVVPGPNRPICSWLMKPTD
jgi:hypothetical protein